MKGKYLITTDHFFYGPDGNQYRAAWGEVNIMEDSILGIKTNRNSTNWYVKVGNEERFVIIAGCQIHYAIRCENKPDISGINSWDASAEHGLKEYKIPNPIYIAE